MSLFTSTCLKTILKPCYIQHHSCWVNQFIFQNMSAINQMNLIHTGSALSAGHSKWSNIRHTKKAQDDAKSKLYYKFSRKIISAVREGGTNPRVNTELGKIIEQAKAANVPGATIEKSMKNAEKALNNMQPAAYPYSAHGGLFIVVDAITDNINRTRSTINGIFKKAGFKEDKTHILKLFEEKGRIVTSEMPELDFQKAMDDAIELGAEDVTEENKNVFEFTCEPKEFESVRSGLEQMNYNIEYAEVDRIPSIFAELDSEFETKVGTALEKVDDLEEVVKITTNF